MQRQRGELVPNRGSVGRSGRPHPTARCYFLLSPWFYHGEPVALIS